MQPPEKHIGAHRADLQRLQDDFRRGLDDYPVKQLGQGGILSGPLPAGPVLTLLGINERGQRMAPRPSSDAGIGAGEVGFGDLEVEGGLAEGLVLGEDNLGRDILVLGLEADAFAGEGIEAIEAMEAFVAADETESCS